MSLTITFNNSPVGFTGLSNVLIYYTNKVSCTTSFTIRKFTGL